MIVPLSVLDFRDRAETFFRNKIGVIDGDKQFTYGEFGQRTHRLANALRGLGVQKGDRVSFLTYNSHQLLEAYYGVIEAGAILNPINVRLKPQDIAAILNHSASKAIFYHKDFAPLVEGAKDALTATEHFVIMEGERGGLATHEYEGLLATGAADYQPAEIDENEIAELFYTSGTTGKPKGVALTHRNLYMNSVNAGLALGFTDEDVILHVVPLFHVNGWGTPHFMTMSGATHVMLRKFTPAGLLELVQKHHVTFLLGVPLIFNAVLNVPNLGQYNLSSLRTLAIGGAPSSPTLVRGLEEKLGGLVMVGYGLSETSPVICLARPRRHVTQAEPPEKRIARQAMTGWAVPGTQLRVVDARGLDVRPDGQQIGEIIVRSNVVMQGYYKDPEATAEAIRDGWFYTGDMATMDEDGYLLIMDRAKDIIISGGENISSVEIENTLYAHPAVLECAVVAAPDEKWGEVPVAMVVTKPGAQATCEELLAYCREHLAGFKVPKEVEFREQLPKGGTGKVLKSELREPYWEGLEKRVH